MAIYTLKRSQLINSNLKTVWDFISSPKNLKMITPDYMGFDIINNDLPEKMIEGLIISYKVSPVAGLKITWVSEITHIKEFEYFIDEQKSGPYRLWHHLHRLEEKDSGILMTDIVNYIPPYYVIGRIANSFLIRKKLNEIFDFRFKKINEIFK